MIYSFSARYAGDTWKLPGVLRDATGQQCSAAGAAIEWKLFQEGGVVALDIDAAGISILDPAAGLFQVNVLPQQTSPLAPGRYRHVARAVFANGDVVTQWTGFIDVRESEFPLVPEYPVWDLQFDFSDVRNLMMLG